jgi:hypothetical protein
MGDVENRRCDVELGALHTDRPYVAFSDDDSWWARGAPVLGLHRQSL